MEGAATEATRSVEKQDQVISFQDIRVQMSKTDEQRLIILPCPSSKGIWDVRSSLVIDPKSDRTLFVFIPNVFCTSTEEADSDEESWKEDALRHSLMDPLGRFPEVYCLPYVRAMVYDYLCDVPERKEYNSVFYTTTVGNHRAVVIEDSLVNCWTRYLAACSSPYENVFDSATRLTKAHREYTADVLMSSEGVQSARHVFEALGSFLSHREKPLTESEASQFETEIKQWEYLIESVRALLTSFGLNPDDVNYLINVLEYSKYYGYIQIFSSEKDPQFADWEKQAEQAEVSREMRTLGGGHYFPDKNSSEEEKFGWIYAALPAQNLDEALIVLMHELGHAYDDLKSSFQHGEQWSVFFELATVMATPNLFEAYVPSLAFLSRSFQYPLFVLLEHIIRGDPDAQPLLNLTACDLLKAKGDYRSWIDQGFEILRKDDRTKTVMKLIEQDQQLTARCRALFCVLFDGLIGNNEFLMDDFSIYAMAFMKAFYVLMHGVGKVFDRISILNRSGLPIAPVDLEQLKQLKVIQALYPTDPFPERKHAVE